MTIKIILIISFVFLVLIIQFFRKWVHFYKIIKFRENLKVGDYCTIKVNKEPVTGIVISIHPEINVIRVSHFGAIYKLGLQEIWP